MATEAPTTTPVVTPNPTEQPWHEQFTDPAKICDQQVRELSSGDTPL